MSAAGIKIFSTHALFEVLGELVPQFERKTGHRLTFSYDPASVVRRHIEGGAAFDVAIVTKPVIEDLIRQGRILPDGRVDFGRCGLGVSVRKGAAKSDIATVEAFKRTLLAAKSVVRSRDGTSGQYFDTLLDRLGIAEAMRGKITLGGSGRVAEYVARGEVELAVQQVSELLPVTGADYAGPFPPELQLYTVFSVGIGAASQNRDAAKAFIEFFTAPANAALFKSKGVDPNL